MWKSHLGLPATGEGAVLAMVALGMEAPPPESAADQANGHACGKSQRHWLNHSSERQAQLGPSGS